jgi:hypothetical protein
MSELDPRLRADVGTKGFAGRALPPFLATFQRLNDAHNAAIRPRKKRLRHWLAWKAIGWLHEYLARCR